MKKNFIALLSGGLDSTVSLAAELHAGNSGLALFLDYGQKALKRERQAAKALAKHFGVEFKEIALPFLKEVTQSALVMNDQVIPQIKMSKLDARAETLKSAQQVWVPNRNGLFLNIAASLAEGLGLQKIIVGFNAEEAVSFPDNSANFVNKAHEFFSFSTLKGLEIAAPTLGFNKSEIVQLGIKLNVPFEKIWSCYQGGRKACGQCESCLRSLRAYQTAGLLDRMQPHFAASSSQALQKVMDANPAWLRQS